MTTTYRRTISAGLAAVVVAGLSIPAERAEAEATSADRAAITAVVEQFRTAIVDKNADRFFSTLYDRKTAWIGSLGQSSWDRARAAKPDASREFTSDPASFINWVTSSDFPIEERFKPVAITNDDAVATVHFEYGFYVKNDLQNTGLETWSLAKTASGWKITSIVYSVNNTH